MFNIITYFKSKKWFKVFTRDTETKLTISLTPNETRDLVRLSDKIPSTGESVILKLGDKYFKCREIF